MEVPVERLLTKISELHKEHYKGNTVTTTDITNIKKTIQRDTIRASGSGVPPPQFMKQLPPSEPPPPPWFGERISATGQGTDPAMGTDQGRMKAARAARMDAMRKLGEQIYGLRINSSTTVQDFVTTNDRIDAQLNAVISGAADEGVRFSGDTAEVTVSVPAAEVWAAVHDEMEIAERRR